MVVVIIILGILVAVALPRFFSGADSARISHAQATTGAFGSAMVSYRAAWLAEARPNSLVLDGKTVTFTNGWPHPAAQTVASCVDLWDTSVRDAEPVEAYQFGVARDHWSTLAFGNMCLYVYHDGQVFSGANQLPFFIYRPNNGQVEIFRYNMS